MLQFLGTGFAAYLKIQAVWEKGRIIPDCDLKIWRLDADGYVIKRCEYNNTESQYGWRVDHQTPEARGGNNELANLRPVSCTGQTAHAGLLDGALSGVRGAFGRAA
ncbi:MAG: HNH endonuclease signature motif containing protein [Phenylobacterium sp.]